MKTHAEVANEIDALRRMTTSELQAKYCEVFGHETRSNHKQYLFRRIAWRIQANAWGGLSERARQRALELANDAELRIRAPKNFLVDGIDEARTVDARVDPASDPRLPRPGSSLVRRYRGKDIVVLVRADGGFECEGRIYKSLSKAVSEATGTRWNGFAFYGLGGAEVKHGQRA